METLLSIFAEIDDPRDHTAQYLLSSMLFIALAATLCGATACTVIADYPEANLAELSEIVDLPGRTPSFACSIPPSWSGPCSVSSRRSAKVSASARPAAWWRWMPSGCGAATNEVVPACRP